MQDSHLLWLPAHTDSVNANMISFRITFSSNRHYSVRTTLEWKAWMEISHCYGATAVSASFKKFKKMMNIDRCWKATSVFCWSSNAWFPYLASGMIQILCNSVGVLSIHFAGWNLWSSMLQQYVPGKCIRLMIKIVMYPKDHLLLFHVKRVVFWTWIDWPCEY